MVATWPETRYTGWILFQPDTEKKKQQKNMTSFIFYNIVLQLPQNKQQEIISDIISLLILNLSDCMHFCIRTHPEYSTS